MLSISPVKTVTVYEKISMWGIKKFKSVSCITIESKKLMGAGNIAAPVIITSNNNIINCDAVSGAAAVVFLLFKSYRQRL